MYAYEGIDVGLRSAIENPKVQLGQTTILRGKDGGNGGQEEAVMLCFSVDSSESLENVESK